MVRRWAIRLIVFSAIILSIVSPLGLTAAMAKFPDKPVTLIVPWSPGGASDMVCRIVAAQMEKELGQPVVVQNMPGAGSLVGARALVTAAPDGYTLGWLGISAAIAQYTSVAPVMMKEYKAVSGAINPPLVLMVYSGAPWKTLKEFVSYAKANPGKVKNGNAGTGVIDHLYSAEFGEITGITFTQVPYQGWGPALAALAGGHVDCVFVAIGSAKAMMGAGKMRPIAIAGDARHPSYPDIPTMKEGGVNIVMPYWESFVVPLKTPDDVVKTLDQAIQKSFRDPATQKRIKDASLDVVYMDTKGIEELRTKSDATVKKIIHSLGLGQK
jgi:tripartite-type tricarboxylate transporter receptor subunit TctC